MEVFRYNFFVYFDYGVVFINLLLCYFILSVNFGLGQLLDRKVSFGGINQVLLKERLIFLGYYIWNQGEYVRLMVEIIEDLVIINCFKISESDVNNFFLLFFCDFYILC